MLMFHFILFVIYSFNNNKWFLYILFGLYKAAVMALASSDRTCDVGSSIKKQDPTFINNNNLYLSSSLLASTLQSALLKQQNKTDKFLQILIVKKQS